MATSGDAFDHLNYGGWGNLHCHLVGGGQGAAHHPTTHRTAPAQRIIWPLMWIVLRLKTLLTIIMTSLRWEYGGPRNASG